MARRHLQRDASEVRQALRLRYAAPEYALFEEVGNATGSRCNRHADAVAMAIWPSRGLFVHGFEIKVERRDWLNEKKNPSKADEVARYCDFWWLVVGDSTIVQAGELPETWGLLELQGKALVCKTEATKLEAEQLDRGFLAAVLRRAHESAPALAADAERRGYERATTEGTGAQAYELKRLKTEVETLQRLIDDFQKKSGVKIDRWSHGDVALAVNKLLRDRHDQADPLRELESAHELLAHHAERLQRAAARLRSARNSLPEVGEQPTGT